RGTDEQLLERLDVDAGAGVGRILLRKPLGDRIEVGLRAARTHAALETSHDRYTGSAARLEIAAIRIVRQRHPHVGWAERLRVVRAHDANDRERLAVERECLSNHVGTRAESRAP